MAKLPLPALSLRFAGIMPEPLQSARRYIKLMGTQGYGGGGHMRSRGGADAESGRAQEQAAADKGSRWSRKVASPAARQPSRLGTTGRRAQHAARDGLAVAGKQASERVADVARRAREAARPGMSRARDGVRQWSALDADVKQSVALSLVAAVAVSAGERLKEADHVAVKLAGITIAAAGPAMAKHAARQVGKPAEKHDQKAPSTGTGDGPDVVVSVDQTEHAGDNGRSINTHGSGPTSSMAEPTTLSEFAGTLGVRQPPDPDALYRDGSEVLELVYPLPEGLTSLPWESLSRRNRFFVLVGAWALREADGIRLLQSGQLEQAQDAFQECLVRSQHLRTPELIARSYEDLGQLAVLSGDESSARKWRANAELVMQGQQPGQGFGTG